MKESGRQFLQLLSRKALISVISDFFMFSVG
jgi:hypothetical protein